jgi:hypothetical protein
MKNYLVLVGLMVSGCGGGSAPDLWITLKNDELHLQLTPIEPNPF